jgi:hypothetical protein
MLGIINVRIIMFYCVLGIKKVKVERFYRLGLDELQGLFIIGASDYKHYMWYR